MGIFSPRSRSSLGEGTAFREPDVHPAMSPGGYLEPPSSGAGWWRGWDLGPPWDPAQSGVLSVVSARLPVTSGDLWSPDSSLHSVFTSHG